MKKSKSERIRPWIAVLLAAIAFGVFANTLNHGFVFDDLTLISQNPQVKQFKWTEILSRSGYRPLRTFTYALNYAFGGERAFGYHLVNVALHALNVAMVYLLFWTWCGSNLWAASGALIFAVHPVQTAAVAYISGRKDLLATLFILLGCWLYSLHRQNGKRHFLVMAIVSFVAGVLCKEVAIVFPALLLLIDAFLVQSRGATQSRHREGATPHGFWRSIWRPIRQWPLVYTVSTILTILSLCYAIFLTQASRMAGLWGGTVAANVGTSLKLFAHYVKLAIFPYPLIADYTGQVFAISKGFTEPSTLLSLALTVGYVLLAIWSCRKNPTVAFSMLWFLAALLPVLQIVPFHEIAADHFLYFPMVGAAFLAGLAIDYLGSTKKSQILAWGVLGAPAIVFAILSIDRNRDWKDEQTLWEVTYRTAPGSYRANTNLGVIYQQQQKSDIAIRHTLRSVELDSSQALPWNNLAAIYHDLAQQARRRGQIDDAIRLANEGIKSAERSIALDATDAFAFANMASCYKELGLAFDIQEKPDKALDARRSAVDYFSRALRMGSDNELFPVIWFSIGMVFVEAGYYDQAIDYLKNFVKAFPDWASAQYWMGFCYFKMNKYRQSIPYLEKASILEPKLDTWGMLAKSYQEIGEKGEAIQTYLRALNQFPNSVEAHYNLGVLYHLIGEVGPAQRHLERALQLSPNGPLVTNIREMLEIIRRRDVSKS